MRSTAVLKGFLTCSLLPAPTIKAKRSTSTCVYDELTFMHFKNRRSNTIFVDECVSGRNAACPKVLIWTASTQMGVLAFYMTKRHPKQMCVFSWSEHNGIHSCHHFKQEVESQNWRPETLAEFHTYGHIKDMTSVTVRTCSTSFRCGFPPRAPVSTPCLKPCRLV